MKTTSTGATARRMSPQERDHSILEGALGLARESGLESLTVRAIAARVGVTPALVAHYRPGMDAFVADVFGSIVAAEREEVISAFDDRPFHDAAELDAAELRGGLLRLIETLLDADRDDVTLIWVQASGATHTADDYEPTEPARASELTTRALRLSSYGQDLAAAAVLWRTDALA